MIAQNIKVIALDDVEDHLIKIVRGLGRAGFSVSPYYYDDGELEDVPLQRIEGVRIVFSDIHMAGGGSFDHKMNAATIAKCLKDIISPGPFVIIFWSEYPADADLVFPEICERLIEVGCIPPIGYGTISKGDVLAASEDSTNFDTARLRGLILEEIGKFKSLLISAFWEDKVFRGAARSTNELFEATADCDENRLEEWLGLLGYLSSEALGLKKSLEHTNSALDHAMLPLLEDQLANISRDSENHEIVGHLRRYIASNDQGINLSKKINIEQVQTGYLIDKHIPDNTKSWERGVVSEIDREFIGSEKFTDAFGGDVVALIRREFATRDLTLDEQPLVSLHAVELGPECDHAQSKLTSQRYLLAVLVPEELVWAFRGQQNGSTRIPKSIKLRNDGVIDVGNFCLSETDGSTKNWSLFISCKCFMAFEKEKSFSWTPRFKLRRALIEDVAHRYVTHARRPGVMRFAA